MTSFVLLNDMKAEASWALLGLTCRLALSLGLHRPQALDGRESPDMHKREIVRRKLWYYHRTGNRTALWYRWLTYDDLGGLVPGTTLLRLCPLIG